MLCVNLLGESTKSWNRIGDRLCTLAYARVNKKKSDCDWSQCPIGIDPNRTLGLIPMSNWDWSQSDIGTDSNGTMGLIPMSNWSQSLIGVDQNLAVVTQRITAGAWLLPMEHGCCDPLGNGGSITALTQPWSGQSMAALTQHVTEKSVSSLYKV